MKKPCYFSFCSKETYRITDLLQMEKAIKD